MKQSVFELTFICLGDFWGLSDRLGGLSTQSGLSGLSGRSGGPIRPIGPIGLNWPDLGQPIRLVRPIGKIGLIGLAYQADRVGLARSLSGRSDSCRPIGLSGSDRADRADRADWPDRAF